MTGENRWGDRMLISSDVCSHQKAAPEVVIVSEGRESSMLAVLEGEARNVMSPPPTPPFHLLILQRATGQVIRHWLHLLHLGCLAFFSSPKWSCKFHVAGRVTDWEMGASKWEIRRGPATSKLHNGLSNQTLDQPDSCHLQFGLINPPHK